MSVEHGKGGGGTLEVPDAIALSGGKGRGQLGGRRSGYEGEGGIPSTSGDDKLSRRSRSAYAWGGGRGGDGAGRRCCCRCRCETDHLPSRGRDVLRETAGEVSQGQTSRGRACMSGQRLHVLNRERFWGWGGGRGQRRKPNTQLPSAPPTSMCIDDDFGRIEISRIHRSLPREVW